MKVFVGYGYNLHDQWIEDMVIPIIEAFGLEVVHGKEIEGKLLSSTIIDKIKSCDLLIGFLSKRQDDTGGGRWVRDELVTAKAAAVPFIPVVENGVDFHGNILGDVTYLSYDEKTRAHLLVNLIKAVAREAKEFAEKQAKALAASPARNTTLLRLEPEPFNRLINKLQAIGEPYQCFYRFANAVGDNDLMEESSWQNGTIVRVPDGYGIHVDMVYLPLPEHTERASVEVKVKYGDEIWIGPHRLSHRPVITMEKIK